MILHMILAIEHGHKLLMCTDTDLAHGKFLIAITLNRQSCLKASFVFTTLCIYIRTCTCRYAIQYAILSLTPHRTLHSTGE